MLEEIFLPYKSWLESDSLKKFYLKIFVYFFISGFPGPLLLRVGLL